jgi:hypothetical protein
MALLMVGAAVLSAVLALPALAPAARCPPAAAPPPARARPAGFLRGWLRPQRLVGVHRPCAGRRQLTAARCCAPLLERASSTCRRRCRSAGSIWLALLLGIGLDAAAGGLGGAARALRHPAGGPAATTSASPARRPSWLFIVLYKLGDAFAGCADDALPAQGHGATRSAEVGVVNKVHRPVADDRRRAAGRRADAAQLGLWRALHGLRRAADWPATWASGGWRWAARARCRGC